MPVIHAPQPAAGDVLMFRTLISPGPMKKGGLGGTLVLALRRTRLACTAALWVLACAAQAQISDIRPQSPLPDAVINRTYSARFTPVNPLGGQPVQWSITPGCLDGTGLTFSPQNGVANSAHITGVPKFRGNFFCTVSALDAGENLVRKLYALSVVRGCSAPRITSPPPPAADPGVPFSFAVTTTGRPPHTFSALGLPPGFAIDPATGVISGTSDASGAYPVTVIVGGCGRSTIQSFTLVVGSAAVALSLASAPNPAVFGQDIAVSVHASGGGSPPTGSVLLCATASGQFCAPPGGMPPAGTPPQQIVSFSSAPLDADGNAAFTLHGLAIQNYVLQAYYGGDATHAPADSPPVDQFVIKGAVLPPPSARAGPALTAEPAPIPALSLPALVALALAVLATAIVCARPR